MQSRSARRARTLGLAACAALAWSAADAAALSVSFVEIADTSTPIPGGSGSFTSFGRNPSVDGGTVAFRGEGDPPTPLDSQQQGIYTGAGGAPALVVDQGTAIPGGVGDFETFTFKPSIDGGTVAWSGDGAAGQEGIYRDAGGGAALVADRNALVPGGQTGELFDLFVFAPVSRGGEVVFHAVGDGGLAATPTEGIYTNAGGTLAALADSNTTMPGTTETFAFLSTPDVDGGAVAFRGWSASGFQGLYRIEPGGLVTVADETTLAPSGLPFLSFGGDPAISGGAIAFRGTDTGGNTGIFVDDGTDLLLVADESTPIPGAPGSTFNVFGNHAIDGGAVVFEGIGKPGSEIGLYTNLGGGLEKVIDTGDALDGKAIVELEISREALADQQVAFWARFADGSEGVFVAVLPEPAAAGPVGLGLVALLARRRRVR